jgi:hypothetical protein
MMKPETITIAEGADVRRYRGSFLERVEESPWRPFQLSAVVRQVAAVRRRRAATFGFRL